MSSFPLISVITVCLNAVEFIEQTIQSVISQTYPFIQYIIIDGGSTDGTVEIIRKYESRLAYWHSKPDQGITHAFNLALAHACGEWILYLNSDDFFLKSSVVEKVVPYLISQKDVDVVFGKMVTMIRQKDTKPSPMSRIWAGPWLWQQFRWYNTIPHPAAFTSRRYFDRVGVFDETFKIAMDYELYLRGRRELRVLYVPLAISGMRYGGRCTMNIVSSWNEGRRAQIKNRALPKGLAWMNFYLQIGKFYLSLFARKFLDPFVTKFAWRDRISAKTV